MVNEGSGDNKVHWGRVLSYAGAFIAFLIGSGFATGQEVTQYFSAYGFKGILGVAVVFLLFLYVGISFMTVGQERNFKNGNEIYRYYCGKVIGTFYDYFSIAFIYMSFIVMVGGAGAAVNQQYGLPVPVGGIALGLISGITVIFGLGKIVDVISKIGPAIIALTLLLGIAAIIKNPEGLTNANSILAEIDILKASTNWLFAAFSYVGFCMLWLAGFLTSLGSTSKSKKESVLGISIGALGFGIALAIIALGILANIEELQGSMVPTLALAESIHPYLALVFSVIVIAGIYTTSVPLLWQVVARFTEENTNQFKILTAVLSVVGIFAGLVLPFDRLVNIVYVVNGYIGIVLLVFMIAKSIKKKSII